MTFSRILFFISIIVFLLLGFHLKLVSRITSQLTRFLVSTQIRYNSMMSSSSATVKVDKATSDLLIGPDWTMNLEICDSINSGHWQAKDVVKAVKKRLQHKNPRVQFLALTLLETMIKNCGDFVHFQVVDRGILQEMVKIVTKKTDMQVREKILVMLDSWQQVFGGPGGKYPQYYWAYTELKRSGVEFPKRSQDSALLFSSPTSHLGQPPPSRYLQIGYGMPNNSSVRLDEAMATDVPNLSSSDLDRFRGVMELLSDMLKAVNPSDQEAVKDEVIVDLVSQCRSNQKQLMQLITSTGDEVLLAQALALNDDIQTLLAKNDAIASGAPLPIEASEPIPEPTTPNAETLALTTQSLHIEDEEKEKEEDDDDFAQLARRNMKNKQVAESSTTASKEQAMTSTGSISEPSSSSTVCNALVLSDPPAPVKISSKEQDMIDLLSLTLSSNPSPPHTPVTPLTPPNGQSGNFPPQPPPTAQGSNYSPQPQPTGQGGNFTPQQPYTALNQGYAPYNSYVAPWAQAQVQPQPQPQQFQQPQMPQTPYNNYPLPPWEAYSGPNSNPFMTSNNQFPASNYAPMHSATQYQQPPQQHYNATPFYSNVRNVQPNAAAQVNVRPYVSPNKVLDDLIDLKPGGTSSPRMSGSQGQGMSGSQK